MMGGGAPINNVGGGQIAGTVEAGDDPPVKKKRKAWNKGKKYMKGSRKQWMVQKSRSSSTFLCNKYYGITTYNGK